MAQSVARQAVNLQVAGSNPAGGDFCCWGNTQTAGFEPAHAEHTRLAGEPRNHLGTSAAAAAAAAARSNNDHAVIVWWLEPHVATVATRVRFPVTGRPAGLEFPLS